MTKNTFYNHSNKEPVLFTFGLGATVSANVINGLPTLTDWKMILYLDENKAFSKTMLLWFPLSFLDDSPDLPVDSLSFSASNFVTPNQQTPTKIMFIIEQ